MLVVWTIHEDSKEEASTMQEAVLLASQCGLKLQEVLLLTIVQLVLLLCPR